MKPLFIALFLVPTFTACFGQFEKATTFSATANFHVVLDGLAMNDAGAGLGLEASFFSKNRLHAILETTADRFIGDKQLYIDPVTGKEAKNAAVYSIKAGPRIFVTPRLALSVTYGPAWHIARDFNYKMDGGFNYSISGFWGQPKKF